MTLKASTGLLNKLLDTGSLKSVFALGFINIYTGAAPASANDAVTGALLCTVSNNSTGIGVNFDAAAAAGIIAKLNTEIWSGVNAAGGVAGYYRHVAPGDTGVLSTTEPRMQGAIATAGAELNLSNTTLTNGATQTIDFYTVQLPTL